MSTTQHRVSDYLQHDLYHSLGAYRVAETGLGRLAERIRASQADASTAAANDTTVPNMLLDLVDMGERYNAAIGEHRNAAKAEQRHPLPERLPLSTANRFTIDSRHETGDDPWGTFLTWAWVPQFYSAAIYVLSNTSFDSKRTLDPGSPEWNAHTLATNLVFPRDGSTLDDGDERERRREARLARYQERRKQAMARLSGPPLRGQSEEAQPAKQRDDKLNYPPNVEEMVQSIATYNLDTGGFTAGAMSLPLFVLSAHAEAHLAMHSVETWKSMSLGNHAAIAERERTWLDQELKRCIALDTFAYSVGRAAPWIFAQDDVECRKVFGDLDNAWSNAVPTRCMWIASQVYLLALHRRAYAYALSGDRNAAYNDYHKLQRLIRDTERRVQLAPVHVGGALEFLSALYGQTHHHIGELYRAEHAHQPALNHFRAAGDRLERVRDRDEIKEAMTDSRWQVRLHISSGKAHYELGSHKESLRCHLEGWRSFLRLLAANTKTETSTGAIEEAIEWLEKVRFEPEIRKYEVHQYLKPVVDQLDGIVVDDRLTTLAAEILLRLGHLLFVLNILPPDRMKGRPMGSRSSERLDSMRLGGAIRDTLAFHCLHKAAECDPHSTLVGADEMKARFRTGGNFEGAFEHKDLEIQRLADVADQWPRGEDNYERLARVAEYLMLRALSDRHDEKRRVAAEHERLKQQGLEPPAEELTPEEAVSRENAEIADLLLHNFFTHTDSINVRKSQAHSFLMRNTDLRRPPRDAGDPAIEFVSMRRYSSAFPLLPRPSAFRALCGGYLVRLYKPRPATASGVSKTPADPKPFGIVVDPGADFVENLFRSDCSLSDIDMIVVTHDHVDHMGALDSLMSLLHERGQLRKHESQPEAPRPRGPMLLVNDSVRERYRSVSLIDEDSFITFDELIAATARGENLLERIPRFPADEFTIIPMSTEAVDGDGHRDLSYKPSYGVCFMARKEGGPSLAIAGDTPQPARSGKQRADWLESWAPALEADLLVTHLSTIPLTELRQLARLDATREQVREADRERLITQATQLVELGEPLLRVTRTDELRSLGERIVDTCESAKLLRTALEGTPSRDMLVENAHVLERRIGLLKESVRRSSADFATHPDLDHFVAEARMLGANARLPTTDASELETIRKQLQKRDPDLQGRIEFALWLRTRREAGAEGLPESLIGRVSENWQPPQGHSYLHGLLDWAREYRKTRELRGNKPGLFVIGELSEELGTVRRQVAARLNETVFEPADQDPLDKAEETERIWAMTADIGLRVLISCPSEAFDEEPVASPPVDGDHPIVQVLCTTCKLDTDRVPEERFHAPKNIREVCVKGENEGIFYNCFEHDPASQDDHTFLEQLERFDVFGR
ncbi:MAG TPA: MBL fold metallo-hydrolase [Thermoleophilaceae bacterium]|nr:MBL fold metallo-hydrolase [Thermoleophilaceae bacterium]